MRATALATPQRIWRRWIRSEHRLLFVLTLAVGVVSGLMAVAFHGSIDLVDRILLTPAISSSLALRVVWIPVLLGGTGLIVGLLLERVVPYARGSGIPEVKYEYLTGVGPRLSVRTVIGKFALGALSIGSGFSLGREGPTVQICAGVGATIARMTRQTPRVARSLVCVGGAAGIAAAFNTPIAAITFALEEIVGNLNQRLLGAIVVATVAAAVVENALLGGQPVFNVPAYALGRWWELWVYALLGGASAVIATIFVKGLLWMRRRVRDWPAVPIWAKPGVGGLLVAVVGIPLPGVLGIGYGPLSSALHGDLPAATMALLSIAKLAATVLSYSWGLAGGIFAPVLYIGGMLGGTFGAALHHWAPSNSNLVGSFALVGMGALFAGAIRAPITSILIIFEMTGDYAIILPLMIANIISYTLAARWQPVPIYDALLEQDGLQTHDDTAFRQLAVASAMTRTVVTAHPEETVAMTMDRVNTLAANALPVLDGSGTLVGIVTRKDLLRATNEMVLVQEVMTRRPVTVFDDQTLDTALFKMGRHAVRQLPVVERRDPHRLLGIVSLRDIADAARPGRMPATGIDRRRPIDP